MIIILGSITTYMHFKTSNIRFIATLPFFNEGLGTLPDTFGVKETIKEQFPHRFNTPENKKNIGVIPEIKHFGAKIMKVEDLPDFNKWYSGQADIIDCSLKYEKVKYCRADVEVLARAVLVFRKLFYDNVIIDPFIYIYIYLTLPS